MNLCFDIRIFRFKFIFIIDLLLPIIFLFVLLSNFLFIEHSLYGQYHPCLLRLGNTRCCGYHGSSPSFTRVPSAGRWELVGWVSRIISMININSCPEGIMLKGRYWCLFDGWFANINIMHKFLFIYFLFSCKITPPNTSMGCVRVQKSQPLQLMWTFKKNCTLRMSIIHSGKLFDFSVGGWTPRGSVSTPWY